MQENCGPNEAAERLSDFTTIARELIAYGRTCKRMETPFQTAKKSAGQWLAVHLKASVFNISVKSNSFFPAPLV